MKVHLRSMEYSVSSIIVAGGQGIRMQTEMPKQFIHLNRKPVIVYSMECILRAFPLGEIIVVVPESYEGLMNGILSRYFAHNPQVQLAYGGMTRFHSSSNGLRLATKDIVMIHDAARPFITVDFLHQLYREAIENDNAIPALTSVESVRICSGADNKIVDRNLIRMIQTPQAFERKKLEAAFRTGYSEIFTDDASVWEASGHQVHLVNGLRNNFKITTPEDMEIAQLLATHAL
ncbi:MAG: 2-C-methyl-D-erythritol 4-phosphate cytidylyltransferase [Taibaiella sp.]|nr:2-C-methyl-D-erythritol 4-phosphate cytidylyltransferase [Taibaiella sp.]